MFAIVRTGGKQYRVRDGDRIAVELLDAEPGDEVTLDEVLLVGPDDGDEAGELTIGEPLVAGASVTARRVAKANSAGASTMPRACPKD